MADETPPVGARLGTETLYSEPLWSGEKVGPRLHAVSQDDTLGLDPTLYETYGDSTRLPAGFEISGEGDQGPRRDEKPAKPARTPRWKRKRSQKPAKQPPHPRQERPAAARTADAKWRDLASTSMELGGIGAITTGSWLIAAWLGLMVLGLSLILLGIATGLPRDT